MNFTKKKHRGLAAFLAAVMAFSMLPGLAVDAFAAGISTMPMFREVRAGRKGDGPEASVELKNGELEDGMFSFTLTPVSAELSDEEATSYDAGSMPVPEETEAANDADGNVRFGEIFWEHAGSYTYEIAQSVPDDAPEGRIYDEKTYEAVAEVSDGFDVSWKYVLDGKPVDAAVFVNEIVDRKAAPSAEPVSLPTTFTWNDDDGILSLKAEFPSDIFRNVDGSENAEPEFSVKVTDGGSEDEILDLTMSLSVGKQKINLSDVPVKVELSVDTGRLVPDIAAVSADDVENDGISEISVVTEEGTVSSLETGEKENAEFEMDDASGDIALIGIGESANPNFLLQHYYWFPEVQRSAATSQIGKTNVEFFDTSDSGYSSKYGEKAPAAPTGSKLPKNGQNAAALAAENRLFYVDLKDYDGEHRLETKDALVPLFQSESTDYVTDSQLTYMTRLYAAGLTGYNSNYKLSEVWVYQPALGPDGKVSADDPYVEQAADGSVKLKEGVDESQIPFIAFPVTTASQDDAIRFTNNKHNPHLTVPYDKWQEIVTAITSGGDAKQIKDADGQAYLVPYSHTDSIDAAQAHDEFPSVLSVNGHENAFGGTYRYRYTVLIQPGTIVRLVAQGTEQGNDGTGVYEQAANFFDYNIGDGYVYDSEANARAHTETGRHETSFAKGNPSQLFMYTEKQGINNIDNYADDGGAKIAFGNANTLTGLGDEKLGTVLINTANDRDTSYKYAAFGLVSGLSYGTQNMPVVTWANGIDGVNWFGLDSVEGKTVYPAGQDGSYNLGFYRKGSTYTLTDVLQGGQPVEQGLRSFTNTAKTIMSNEFWPLDAVGDTDGHDFLFGSAGTEANRQLVSQSDSKSAPISDGTFGGTANPGTDKSPVHDHNSFFGMSYTLNFTIEPGYEAPLAYWFYGDDDLWVFLEKMDETGNPIEGQTKLVADIGSVHSSIGEYVNLWDYIEEVPVASEKGQAYRLTVFYTERGASGSTCYMRFSVPMTVDQPDPYARDEALVIEKQVLDDAGKLIDPRTAAPSAEEVNSRKVFVDHPAGWWPDSGTDLAAQLKSGALKLEDGYFVFKVSMRSSASGDDVYHDLYDYAVFDKSVTPDHTAVDAENQRLEWGSLGDDSIDTDGEYYFALRSDEYIVISNLPDGTHYRVEEIPNGKHVISWQKGWHGHDTGTQSDTLEESVNGSATTGDAWLSAAETNYIRFTNSPAAKTELTPGDGESVQEGDEIEYGIHWGNGLQEGETAVVRDRLDPGVDFVGARFGDTGAYLTMTADQEKQLANGEIDYVEWDQSDGGTVRYDPDYRYDPSEAPNTDDDPEVQEALSAVFGEAGPTVIWTWTDRQADSCVVGLKVRVNGKAAAPETEAGKDGSKTPRVENKAFVQVGNGTLAVTGSVENPSWAPAKTEVQVDHTANPGRFPETVQKDPSLTETAEGDIGPSVRPGDKIRYRISWKNFEDHAATVVVSDVLDENLEYIERSAKAYEYADPDVIDESTGLPAGAASEAKGAEITYDSASRKLTWTFALKNAGAQGYVEFDAVVGDGASGTLWNEASVKAGAKPELGTRRVGNSVPEDPKKTEVSPGAGVGVKIGDEIRYEISYANYEAGPVTVVITDVLENGLDYVDGTADAGGSYDAGTRTLSWEIADVPAGTAGAVHFTAKVNGSAGAKIENAATVQIGDNPAVSTGPVANPVPHKESVPENGTPAEVGNRITYTIRYANVTEEAITVKIRDAIDKGLTVDESSISDNGTLDKAANEITWTLENVEPGTEGHVSFAATVNSDSSTRVDNTAYIAFGDNPETATETLTHPVPHKEEVTPGEGETVSAGDEITYRIFYENPYDTAVKIAISDKMDDGLDFVSASDNGSYDESTRTVSWTFDAEPGLGKQFVELTAKVNGSALHKVENKADVTYGDYPSVGTERVPNPAGGPHKTERTPGEGVPVNAGDTVTYEISYENDTESIADIRIRDTLDAGVDFVEASNDGTYDEQTRTVSWVVSKVGPGNTGSVTLTVKVNERAAEKHYIGNTAFAAVGNLPEQQTETVVNPEGGPYKNELTPGAGELVQIGDEIVYEIGYLNNTGETADVTITDKLDDGLDFIEASDDGVYDENTRTVTWTIRNTGAGFTGKVTLKAKVNEKAGTYHKVSNTASVKVGDGPQQQTGVVTNPEGRPKKREDSPGAGVSVKPGDRIDYTISWRNYRDEAARVLIMDTLDPGVDFLFTDNGGVYHDKAGTLADGTEIPARTVVWDLGTRNSGAEGTVVIAVQVNADAVDGYAYNEAADGFAAGEGNDDTVFEQARVKVGDGAWLLTDRIQNPAEPADVPEIASGNLSVTKHVTGGGDTTRIWHFRITLDPKVDAAYGGVAFTDGAADITLTDGETLRLVGIPAGTKYGITETEADTDGYQTSSEGDTGVIAENGESSAVFTNHKPETGSLTVTKRVTGGGNRSRAFAFLVRLSQPLDGTYGAMRFYDGVASFSLMHGDSVTAEDLPEGITYSVTEIEDPDYTSSATGARGVIVSGGSLAEFTNEYIRPETVIPEQTYNDGSLTVMKTVSGGGEADREWHFTVVLGENLTGAYGGMMFKNGVAEITLKHGGYVTAFGLPEGIGYSVTELEADDGLYLTTSENASGVVYPGTVVRFVNTMMQNTGKNVPDTGVTERYGWLFGIAGGLLIMAGACVVLYIRRKRK